jgi:hypothetical protein
MESVLRSAGLDTQGFREMIAETARQFLDSPDGKIHECYEAPAILGRCLGRRSSAVVEREPDFEGDLIVRHLTVFDMAARLHHLKPADLPQSARRTADGVLDRVLDALLRRASDFDDSVNVVGHRYPPFG